MSSSLPSLYQPPPRLDYFRLIYANQGGTLGAWLRLGVVEELMNIGFHEAFRGSLSGVGVAFRMIGNVSS